MLQQAHDGREDQARPYYSGMNLPLLLFMVLWIAIAVVNVLFPRQCGVSGPGSSGILRLSRANNGSFSSGSSA